MQISKTVKSFSQTSAPFIAFAGVMGVGKTTLAQALADLTGVAAFLEPGAEAWPVPAGEHWHQHMMALEQWTRDKQLTSFMNAQKHTESGLPAISDGCYFLLAKKLIHHPSCQYYYGKFNTEEKQQVEKLAEHDWHHAPRPDIIVLVEADPGSWIQFLLRRGRSMDKDPDFIKNYLGQQAVIRAAVEEYTSHNKIDLICFQNSSGVIQEAARLLYTAVAGKTKALNLFNFSM